MFGGPIAGSRSRWQHAQCLNQNASLAGPTHGGLAHINRSKVLIPPELQVHSPLKEGAQYLTRHQYFSICARQASAQQEGIAVGSRVVLEHQVHASAVVDPVGREERHPGERLLRPPPRPAVVQPEKYERRCAPPCVKKHSLSTTDTHTCHMLASTHFWVSGFR